MIDIKVYNSLRERQIDNLKEALLCLHRATIYTTLDSSLALHGEIDLLMMDLERFIRNERRRG
jgi:hypothetical protein